MHSGPWHHICTWTTQLPPSLSVKCVTALVGIFVLPCQYSTLVDVYSLGRHEVSAESIDSFKKRLDEFMDRDDRWDG